MYQNPTLNSSLDKLLLHLPRCPLAVISDIIPRIRMNQRTKRSPPNHQPAHKRAKLLWSKHVHFEHADRVRSDGSLEHRINAQFGELPPDALVQFFGVLRLRRRGLLEVDMDIEAPTGVVGDGRCEGGVRSGLGGWFGVDVGFCVGAGWGSLAGWVLGACFGMFGLVWEWYSDSGVGVS